MTNDSHVLPDATLITIFIINHNVNISPVRFNFQGKNEVVDGL